MNRLSNSWRLCRASWRVLSRDRELMAVPLVAGTAALLVFVLVAGGGMLLLGGTGGLDGDENPATNWAVWLIFALAAAGATWVAAIGQAAIVAGAGQRMDGGNPTLESAFAVARARIVRLLEWAVLATAVSVVVDQIEQRFGLLGRIVGWLGNVAFGVLSFLALPVIVFEDVGAIEAFKRSSTLLKSTWGEQVAFSFGIGLLGFLLALPALVLAGVMLANDVLVLQIVGLAAAIVWMVLVLALASALSAVFKTALYRYARGLHVDAAFSTRALAGAFRARETSQTPQAGPAREVHRAGAR